MIRCVIVNSDTSDRKNVENLVSQIKNINVIETFNKLADARSVLEEQMVDILFLDIPTPGSNGIGLLDELEQGKPKIIVTSSSKEVAHHAFDIEAVDFILKPVTVPRIIKALSKALEIKNRDEKKMLGGRNSIFIKVAKQFVKLNLKEVFLIEALADYVHINTDSKRYTIHSTMKAMEGELPETDFIRVHKSYIVRLDRITELKNDKLYIGGKSIPVGSSYRKELLSKMGGVLNQKAYLKTRPIKNDFSSF